MVFQRATIRRLPADRLHLSHGPIDVVLKAWGEKGEVEAAYGAVAARFEHILPELTAELAGLRRPISDRLEVGSPVACRMVAAVQPFSDEFVTPMAAVAGAVADELLAVMVGAAPVTKAFVNDGGDIAIHLAAGESLTIGVAGDFAGAPIPAINGSLRLQAQDHIGGVATSGFQGRSFTFGIADSVTVLGANAAAADAAATMVANKVCVESAAVERRPASELDPDADLGDRLVTAKVGRLSQGEIAAALENGARQAERYLARGLIRAAALVLRGETRVVGSAALLGSQHPGLAG